MESTVEYQQGMDIPKGKNYKTIGTRPIRHDGTDKVTGRAMYGIDTTLPGMLYGAVLRSPYSHARILHIDTSKAEKLAGVKGVITAKDLPGAEDKVTALGEGTVNFRYESDKVLANSKALYFGHAVAAVCATNIHIAQEAVKLIEVEYEELPFVGDVRKAMEDSSPKLLEGLRTDELGKKGDKPTNIAAHYQFKEGDIETGFKEADVIVEREFTTSMVHQGYIEPVNATGLYNNDGQITIWTSTQSSFDVRGSLSAVLKIPVSKIKVIPMEIGGGFGGKIAIYLEPLAVLLSKKSGFKPVKFVMSRAEVLSSTGPTSGSYIKVKIGATKKGKITAAQAYLAYEAGAYPGAPVMQGLLCMLSHYNIQNCILDGYDVVVNKPKTQAYRAPGTTNAFFASESVIDELSERLQLDPLDFRLINAVKEGDKAITGLIFKRVGFRETLESAKNHPHYKAKLEGPNRARGVAAGVWYSMGGRSSVSAKITADGTVNLLEGSTDIGGSRVSLAMQLAETLEIPVTDINPTVVDTNSVGYNDGTYGSRTTYATGMAVHQLGLDLKEKLLNEAGKEFSTEPEKVNYADGVFTYEDKKITFKELAKKIIKSRPPITASTSVRPSRTIPGYAVHIVDVEADTETGKVQILRYTAFQDVGTAIHPSYVEGQIQGGVAQGIGWALNEEYIYNDKGVLVNNSFLDYRIPTALDLPMIDAVLIEVPEPDHPFGVRGVGEPPITPPAAAIANAIAKIIGKRVNKLPMSPRTLYEVIYGNEEDS